MPHFKVNQKDIFFILKEQLNYASLCTLDRYKNLNEKALDMLVTEAISFARGELDPLQEIGEKWGVKLEDHGVTCPPEFRKVFKQYGQDGWTAAARDMETVSRFRLGVESGHPILNRRQNHSESRPWK